MMLKRGLIPTQDDLENVRRRGLRPRADTDADAARLSQEQIVRFLQASQEIEFAGQNWAERYQFVQRRFKVPRGPRRAGEAKT